LHDGLQCTRGYVRATQTKSVAYSGTSSWSGVPPRSPKKCVFKSKIAKIASALVGDLPSVGLHGLAELGQGFALNLANSFPSETQTIADLFERLGLLAV